MNNRHPHSIPVVFFNGHRSHNLGCVNVGVPVSYVSLQTIVSRSLRVPPEELSIWLVRSAEAGTGGWSSAEPVGETTDISAAVRASDGDCYVLVGPLSLLLAGSTGRELRMGIWDYERMVAAAAAAGSVMGVRMQPKAPWANAMAAWCVECEAARREGKSPEFHHCVNDRPVKVGFQLRPAAGPVQRLKKKM